MSKELDFYIITAEGCGGCAALKNHFSKEIEQQLLKVMDVMKDDEAAQIASELGVRAVPQVVAVNKNTKNKELCQIDQNGKITCSSGTYNIRAQTPQKKERNLHPFDKMVKELGVDL